MKQIFALILSALLLSAAVLPVLADGRALPAPGADPSAPAEAAPSAEAAPAEVGPDVSLAAASLQSAPNEPRNNAGALRFQDLRGALRNYNGTVLSLEAQIRDLNGNTTDSPWDAIISLEQMKSQLESALGDLGGAAGGTKDPNLLIIYQTLGVSIGAQVGSLEGQIATLRSQLESLDDNVESGKNTLNNAVNQVVKGAETLYIGIVALESGLAGVERGLAALDRLAAITEKQQELGLASAYDVESVRHQRSQLASQLESLKFNAVSNKILLEGMCGMALNGAVVLEPLPLPTQAELDGVDYNRAVNTAMARNVDVANAEIANNRNSGAVNRQTLAAARDTFAASFKVVCLTVSEDARLVAAAQDAVDFQRRTFEIAAKKYELGMLSHEEYLSAQSELDGAGDDLAGAQRELFTAYRGYVWATQYGIV